MEDDLQQRVKIDRPVYEQDQLNKDCEYEKPSRQYLQRLRCKPITILYNVIPVLQWFPKYQWKKDFIGDLIAGFTVAIMHIPQGMAYSLLANVPAVVGIYTAVFPVIIYFFLGTSRHNSMGTFAVVCLMTGKAVLEYSDHSYFHPGMSTIEMDYSYTPLEVATVVTFMVGLVQLAMYFFRLGIISTLLSETLVSGFTTAAAFHVLTSQVKDILGIIIPRPKGYFTVVKTWISIFTEITNVNYIALSISAVTVAVILINNEILKPRLAKKCIFPIPIELIVVVTGTVTSFYLDLSTVYDIHIVGAIPSGLPVPTIPDYTLIDNILVDAIIIGIVSYALSLSMALIFAQKLNYEVDSNQELLAQSVGNLVGSMFSCVPFTASISRSLLQETVGGKTQVSSIISCGILVLVLIWIGPLFEMLPTSVLASIIIVALKGMLKQVTYFVHVWKLSKLDATVWIITFLTVIFVSIDIGLLVGFLLSVAVIIIMGFKPYTCLLGVVPNTDIYLDISRYKMVVPLDGLVIFHYSGGLNFALRDTFKLELYRKVGIHPQKELVLRKKIVKLKGQDEGFVTEVCVQRYNEKLEKLKSKTTTSLSCIILDFSAVSYIDQSGVSTLKLIGEEYSKINIPVYVAGCCGPVYEMMNRCKLLEGKCSLRVFPTVHDAVESAISIFNLDCLNAINIISKL